MRKKICIIFVLLLLLKQSIIYADVIEDDDDDYLYELLEEIVETSADLSKEPIVNSKSAIVIDRESKRVLYSKNKDKRRAMASTTKIMTCILAIEKGNLSDIVTISKESAMVGGSTLGVNKGDKISLNDLLYGLMLCSGNDCAVQIAQSIGGSYDNFIQLMNNKAEELGLGNTSFATPHGLDNDNHYTTAYELAILTDYALKNKEFAKIVNTKERTIKINGITRKISNTNELLGYMEGVNGVKTGYTSCAGRCLVISCKRDGLDLISVVLGADTKKNRTMDSMNILKYCYANYSNINIKETINNKFQKWLMENNIEIIKGKEKYVKPELNEIAYTTYPVTKMDGVLNIYIECEKDLEAPVYSKMKVGELRVYLGDSEIAILDLTIPNTIDRKEPIDYWQELWKELKRCFSSFLLEAPIGVDEPRR